jgi:hypothetical protein
VAPGGQDLASCTRSFGWTGTDQVCSSGFKIFGCFEIADQSVLEKKISNREFSENSIIEKKIFKTLKNSE